jgi:hypothetical protein
MKYEQLKVGQVVTFLDEDETWIVVDVHRQAATFEIERLRRHSLKVPAAVAGGLVLRREKPPWTDSDRETMLEQTLREIVREHRCLGIGRCRFGKDLPYCPRCAAMQALVETS